MHDKINILAQTVVSEVGQNNTVPPPRPEQDNSRTPMFLKEFTNRFTNKGCDSPLNSTKPIKCIYSLQTGLQIRTPNFTITNSEK